MGRFLLAVGLGLTLAAVSGFAEDPAPAVGTSAPTAADSRVTELQTAGYYELVARARELGLATTGSVAELRSRVAQALGVTLPSDQKSTEGTTLTIDSAREAGLVEVDAPGEGKLLHISGGLKVTLVDNEKKVTHIIEAAELWYDQANEEMTARGQVVYTMVRESSKEVFRGESLTFRLSDSQGVFYEGASDRARTVGSQALTFRYGGHSIRRSSGDLVVLDTGTITSSLGAEPYYRIQAKTIWVLAPGEWGLQDAVLYLGRIPVLYFPFFFQPGDEFFFNPVLSFPDAGDRRGTSLQTTTYFWGKKTKESSSFSFLQMADDDTSSTEMVRRGLFLVRGKAPKSEVPESWVLKYQADFYANLGFLTGVTLSTPGALGLKALSGTLGLGVTRTVDDEGVPFSVNPFQAALDPWAQSDWNSSWLGPLRLPFRWGGKLDVDAGWGTLGIEYYSDTLLYSDLTASRSENFSVFSLLGLGSSTDITTATAKSSLSWSATANVAPATLAASLLWESKSVPTAQAGPDNDPENTFYVPSQLILPQLTLSWSGTLWPPTSASTSGTASPSAGQRPDPQSEKKTASAVTAGSLIPPSDGSQASGEDGAGVPAAFDPGSDPVIPEPSPEPVLVSPGTMESLASSSDTSSWTTGVTWSFKPTVKTDTRFNTSSATLPSDSPWEVLLSRYAASYDGKLNLTTGTSDSALTFTEGITLHQQVQDTWYLGPAVTSTAATTYNTQDRTQTSSLLSQTLGSTWKPFTGTNSFRESSLQYTLTTKLWEDTSTVSRVFDGTTDTVTTHQTTATAVWYLLEGTPTLKAQAAAQSTLPPLDPVRTYTPTVNFSLASFQASATTAAKQTKSSLVWDPLVSTAAWAPWTSFSLNQSFSWDLEYSRPSVSTSTLTLLGLSTIYRHQRTTPYTFDTANRKWVAGSSQDFLPSELRFTYSYDLPSLQWWYYRNTLTSKLSFAWPINLQKYSDMPMTLSYTLGYKLSRFVDFSLTGGVKNATAYRYFPALANSFGDGVVATVNPLKDLWDSVSIWDQQALHRTGFKMTTLSLSAVHYLDDWQVKLTYSGTPTLNTAGTRYDWVGTMSLLVQWYPITELKTQMDWDKNGALTIAKNSS